MAIDTENARKALLAYLGDDESMYDARLIPDLIADLMHLADASDADISGDWANGHALVHYYAEVETQVIDYDDDDDLIDTSDPFAEMEGEVTEEDDDDPFAGMTMTRLPMARIRDDDDPTPDGEEPGGALSTH